MHCLHKTVYIFTTLYLPLRGKTLFIREVAVICEAEKKKQEAINDTFNL